MTPDLSYDYNKWKGEKKRKGGIVWTGLYYTKIRTKYDGNSPPAEYRCFFFSNNYLFHPVYYLRPVLFSFPASRNSDPGSHSRLFPTKVRALHSFYRVETSALTSLLVDSRRIVPTHATRSQQLTHFVIFAIINSKSHHSGIRTHGPNAI